MKQVAQLTTRRAAAFGSVRSRLADYADLAKPGIVALILLTTAAGMVMAEAIGPPPGAPLSPWLTLAVVTGVGLAAAGGGTLNCYIDRDIDAVMRRTASRPLPAGRVPPSHALAMGVGLSALGVAVMALSTHWLATLLTVAGWLIYVGVYSLWLKRRTPQNIVIGGAAGALGPVIGWAAVQGGVAPLAMVLFLIVFLWTPPHFWALALLGHEDYRRAGVPMMPVVAGDERTRRQVLAYTVMLAVVSVLPAWLGVGGAAYPVVALVSGGLYVAMAWRAWRRPSRRADRLLFHYSILYLAVVYTALVFAARPAP